MKSFPLLSVIICTYNRAALLEKCLDSLTKQEMVRVNVEIVVVDNNSTDSTKYVVNQFQQRLPNMKYVFAKKQGLSYARNKGYEESTGEYLVYLDDDALAPPAYLSILASVINQNTPDIVGGPAYPYYLTDKPSWFKDTYVTRLKAHVSGFSETVGVTGCNFAIRRDVLAKIGLFDPSYGMRGNELGLLEEKKMIDLYRLKTEKEKQKVYYSIEWYIQHYVHPHQMNPIYLCRRKWDVGITKYRLALELGEKFSIEYFLRKLFYVVFLPFRVGAIKMLLSGDIAGYSMYILLAGSKNLAFVSAYLNDHLTSFLRLFRSRKNREKDI